MKKNIDLFILFLVMAGILAWCIIQHDDRIIFPILIIFLLVISFWRITVFFKEAKKQNTIIMIKVGYIKHQKLLNVFFSIFYFGMTMLNVYYLRYPNFYLLTIPYFILTFGIMYFTSPKHLVFNEYGVSYTFWRVKWNNLKSYDFNNDVLTIKTFENKEHVIKGIDRESKEKLKTILYEKATAVE